MMIYMSVCQSGVFVPLSGGMWRLKGSLRSDVAKIREKSASWSYESWQVTQLSVTETFFSSKLRPIGN